MERIIIGVDGGGSKSTGAAADRSGRVLAVARSGGVNYNNIGMEKARENLYALVNELTRKCGADYAQLMIGHCAADGTLDRETVEKVAGTMLDPNRMLIESDAYMALLGLTKGEPGLIAICGTGSMLVMDDGKNGQRAAGGWGHLLGDPGSGYALALDGLKAAIACWERTGPDTALGDRALQYFHISQPRQLIDRVYAPGFGQKELADFAPMVIGAAEENDQAALDILNKNMLDLAKEAWMLLKDAPDVKIVGLYGGIFQHALIARKMFCGHLEAMAQARELRFTLPDYPPELGALIHYFRGKGQLTEDLLFRMKTSYDALVKGGNIA